MSDKKAETGIKELAGGWITEKTGTDVPKFLKFVFPVIILFCATYLIVYMNGEVNHSTRGRLVQQFNAATMSSSTFMYVVGALIVVYLLILMKFVFGKADHE